MNCYIREHSTIAKIAAWKLRSEAAAIVIGRTIYLHNASKDEFLANTRWLRHELVHIKQFLRHGFFLFLLKYLWESMLHGYIRNKFEVEARQGESDDTICDEFLIVR